MSNVSVEDPICLALLIQKTETMPIQELSRTELSTWLTIILQRTVSVYVLSLVILLEEWSTVPSAVCIFVS